MSPQQLLIGLQYAEELPLITRQELEQLVVCLQTQVPRLLDTSKFTVSDLADGGNVALLDEDNVFTGAPQTIASHPDTHASLIIQGAADYNSSAIVFQSYDGATNLAAIQAGNGGLSITNYVGTDSSIVLAPDGNVTVYGPLYVNTTTGGNVALLNRVNVFTTSPQQLVAPGARWGITSPDATAAYLFCGNVGNTSYFGVESSAGTTFGATPYATVIYGATAGRNVEVFTNSIRRLTIDASGNATLTGLLTVSGFGTHSFSAGGTGHNDLTIENTANGASNYAVLNVNAGAASANLFTLPPGFTSSGIYKAAGAVLQVLGSGGLSIVANDASGAIRFYSGGATERMRISESGSLCVGTTVSNARVCIESDMLSVLYGIFMKNLGGVPGTYVDFRNSAGTPTGSIVQNATTTVAFNTTSDQRLKTDRGVATDVSVLRSLIVHDFAWNADSAPDRGLFAQEARQVFARAVTTGSDGDDLSKPWMIDYSKFVPDLIVGWQQHDARLNKLEEILCRLQPQN